MYKTFSFLAICMTAYLKEVKKCVTGIEADEDCLKLLYEVCSRESVASVKVIIVA